MTTDHTVDASTGDASTRASIYVASLSDYNAGRLHGRWIDASRGAEEIMAEVEAMLQASPSPDAEEWAIHDYEGFGPIRLSEWESFDRVAALAERIETHGEAFAAWFADAEVESVDDLEEAFGDAYQGEFASLAEYAQTLAEETGVLHQYAAHDYSTFQQPDDLSGVWPFSCIDWDRAGQELIAGGDVWTATSVSGVFVFRTY
jgi:antirestriction protein